jgi:hypothetical protein
MAYSFALPTMSRGDIKKTPGRLVYTRGSDAVSMFSKLGTAIERQIVHDLLTVGTDAGGELDYRDREYHVKVRITPDGRFGTHTANVLWPTTYRNYTPGQPMFATGSDYSLAIHGSDASLETFASAALETMPPIRFAATETLVGQAEFLCLRAEAAYWAGANSLVTQADSGGTLVDDGVSGADADFTPAAILTQPYYGVWAAVTPNTVTTPLSIQTFDTLDGFWVEFTVNWSDDERQAVGLYNRRIKSIGARIRCSPLGATRASILAAQVAQGTGAKRGRSIQSNSGDFSIYDGDGNLKFTIKNAALTEDKQSWSTDAVRETDLVWHATRTYAAGVLGALFSIP